MGKEWEMRCDQLKKRRRIRRSLKYCQIASWRLQGAYGKAYEQQRNRPESVFIRGNCEAVHQSDLFQITDSRGCPGEAQVSFGDDGREKLTGS